LKVQRNKAKQATRRYRCHLYWLNGRAFSYQYGKSPPSHRFVSIIGTSMLARSNISANDLASSLSGSQLEVPGLMKAYDSRRNRGTITRLGSYRSCCATSCSSHICFISGLLIIIRRLAQIRRAHLVTLSLMFRANTLLLHTDRLISGCAFARASRLLQRRVPSCASSCGLPFIHLKPKQHIRSTPGWAD
jgi:hypothetical protein